MIFLRIFKHLLPRSKAFNITTERSASKGALSYTPASFGGKTLRKFIEGLASGIGPFFKTFIDLIWFDIFPLTTTQIDLWESQWGLLDTGITEAQRRDRLSAAWSSLGGQSPRYIQDTLQSNGFDVYVHQWWEPGTNPPVVRNPFDWLRPSYTTIVSSVECGTPGVECGEAIAECGNSSEPLGYPLVNKIFTTIKDEFILCGEAIAECGEPEAICGNYNNYIFVLLDYTIPIDPDTWPYFLYIGGEIFGELARVEPIRRNEFEALCLKICPTQQWLGMLVGYN